MKEPSSAVLSPTPIANTWRSPKWAKVISSAAAVLALTACTEKVGGVPTVVGASVQQQAHGTETGINPDICKAIGLDAYIKLVDPQTYQQIQEQGPYYPSGTDSEPGSLNWYGSEAGDVYRCDGHGISGVEWRSGTGSHSMNLEIGDPEQVHHQNDDVLHEPHGNITVGSHAAIWYESMAMLEIDEQGHALQFELSGDDARDSGFRQRLSDFIDYAVPKIIGPSH